MISLILMATLNSAPITIEFHGTLREALREVAKKGGLNLVATGCLLFLFGQFVLAPKVVAKIVDVIDVFRRQLHLEDFLALGAADLLSFGSTVLELQRTAAMRAFHLQGIWHDERFRERYCMRAITIEVGD